MKPLFRSPISTYGVGVRKQFPKPNCFFTFFIILIGSYFEVHAPIAHAARSNKRPPNRMVKSWKNRVFQDFTVLLIFLIEAGISWSAPELHVLYLRVLKNISKVTNI